ncbi:MAG: DUF1223 domain-containing protein [Chitinophagales bacterium]
MKNILLIFSVILMFYITPKTTAQTLYEKQTLVEHFTSEHCGSCANYNPTLMDFLETQSDKVAVISYHVYWWQGSIFYQNEDDHTERTEFYDNPGTPRAFFDGQNVYSGPSFSTIDNATINDLSSSSTYNVALNESISNGSANIEIAVTPSSNISSNDIKIFAVVIEENQAYDSAPGVNGETDFHYVMRDIIVDNEGVGFSSLLANSTTNINTSFDFPIGVNINGFRTIVFVQNIVTKEVLQTFIAPNSTGTNVNASTPCLNCVEVKATAFLEGAYNETTGEMRTGLTNVMELEQPYNRPPWNYNGSEKVQDIPTDVVDWILLETMDNDFDIIERRAAFLRKDGTIVDIDGKESVTFYELTADTDYHLVVRHRNHIALLSADMISLPNEAPYDFSQSGAMYGSNVQAKQIDTEKYAMIAGDFDADGVIIVVDFNIFREDLSIISEYVIGDCNFDGNVTVTDFNYYRPNISFIGISQIRL